MDKTTIALISPPSLTQEEKADDNDDTGRSTMYDAEDEDEGMDDVDDDDNGSGIIRQLRSLGYSQDEASKV